MSAQLAVASGREIDPDGVELSRLRHKVDLPGWSRAGGIRRAGCSLRRRTTRCSATTAVSGSLPAGGRVAPGARARSVRPVRDELPPEGREDRAGTVSRRRSSGSSAGRCAGTLRPRRTALCLVCCTPGHERGARTLGLCVDCDRHRRARRQTVEAFVAGHPRLGVPQPRPSFGRCLVDDCRRWAISELGFCRVCQRRWQNIPVADRASARERFLAAGPWQPPLDGWRAVMPAVPELVEWQLLAGLQLLIEPYGVTMALDRLAMAWAHVARARVGSVLELGELPGTYPSQRALEIAMIAARRLTTTPEEERVKDVWDLGVFGLGEKRAMDFTGLHQRWLRESVKGYTIERLSSRKLRTAHRDLGWMRHLSEYLHARDDRGEQPSALTREDMTAFLSWLRVKVPENNTRNLIVGATRRNVAFARRHLAQSGQAAEHIGGGFQLYHEDLPARTLRDPDEPGRALPPVVLAQLLDEDVLAPLGSKHLEYRLGFELIAHSGRRPGGDLQPRGGLPALRGRTSARMAASSAGRCCATCARNRRASGSASRSTRTPPI